jgi:flagellar hook-associated protein 2
MAAVTNTGNGSGIIQSTGVGSGLDIQSLVTQLVAAEGQPETDRLTAKASSVATDISAVGTLKGALSSFQSTLTPLKSVNSFNALSATVGDDGFFTATAGTAAVTGSYDVEVHQLASADKLVSTAFTGGASSTVGTGTLTLALGTTTFSLQIDTSNNTVAGIRDAINKASNNPGIQATLVYGATGPSLVLSSTRTGAANTIRVSSGGGDGGLAVLDFAGGASTNYTLKQTAQDAIVMVSGVEVHSPSNTVSGAIDGVDLTLTKADPGNTHTLTVATDQTTILANLQKFVDAYNGMRKSFNTLTAYDASTQVAGPLLGDSMMNSIDDQMRRLTLNQVTGIAGPYTSLASIGITSGTDGTLTLDSTKLQAALAASPSSVAQLFGSTSGIANRLDTNLNALLDTGGMLDARNQSLASDQKTINTQKQALSDRLSVIQTRYLTQFNALDSLLSQLKQTSNFLTQQLDSISSIGITNSSSKTSGG